MDVGLNNRNTLGEVAPELADVVFLVEATSTEQHNLWSEWAEESMTNIEPLDDKGVGYLRETFGVPATRPGYLSTNHKLLVDLLALNDKGKRYQPPPRVWWQVRAGFPT